MKHVANQQLFSEVYLRELQAQKTRADVLDACRQTMGEWRAEYPDMCVAGALRDYTAQCLSAMGVAYSTRPEGGFQLFASALKDRLAGICLLVTDDDLGRAVKGRHHQARLVRELRAAGLDWGLLTNGRRWRLCRANTTAPYEAFLDADADALLEDSDLSDFLIFHRFMGGEAFGVGEDGRLGLEIRLAESDARTEAVERHLKARIEPILQSLCLGFVESQPEAQHGRADLDEIYRNAMYLLYRILFLFYAEARELLPVNDPRYHPAGLAALVEEARLREEEGVQGADPHELWSRLKRLCQVVDDGDDDLGVAPYNGGLFSDQEKPYLQTHRIAEHRLAPALYDLAFEKVKGGSNRIDYRDLSVRHLGTLYEGLLEYRLNLVSREPMVVRESKGKRTYIPESRAGAVKKGEDILDVGAVYFADDKGERKSTGSYYTPEDVVQYIVSNTVVPKLEERRAALDALLGETATALRAAASDQERASLQAHADRSTLQTVQDGILRLRILDPAMGSGHFLVAAGQAVTNFIVETLNCTDWPNDSISTDPLEWKRRVVERCLYGVDLNPLAQELAKLSLWIASASAGKPLTFLDHHLKIGNSLYGAPLARIAVLPSAKRPEGATLQDFVYQETVKSSLETLSAIRGEDSDDIQAVKRKGAANRQAESILTRLRDVSDVWLGTLFGLKTSAGLPLDDTAYAHLLEEAGRTPNTEAWEAKAKADPLVRQARAIAEREQFFHWELEFPEAVVDGGCRFDAVIANPPYVGTSANLAIRTLFATAKCGDLYAWLFERALGVAGNPGNVGTIVPLSLMFSRDFRTLRAAVLRRTGTARFANFDASRDGIFPPSGKTRNHQRATIATLTGGTQELKVGSTNLLRWISHERPHLIPNIRYSDVTRIASEEFFPKLGDASLVDFWQRARAYGNTIRDNVPEKPDSEDKASPTDEQTALLFVPNAAGYFISALPWAFKASKLCAVRLGDEWTRDVAMLALNSNVFYWLWCVVGDGFDVTMANIESMVLPRVAPDDEETRRLRDALLGATEECASFHSALGQRIPNFNFNKRMDILLSIDAWIMKHVAPDLHLPPDIFAQYKSNSFLKKLDLASLMSDAEEVAT